MLHLSFLLDQFQMYSGESSFHLWNWTSLVIFSAFKLSVGCLLWTWEWNCLHCNGWSASDLGAQDIRWSYKSFQWEWLWEKFEWLKVIYVCVCLCVGFTGVSAECWLIVLVVYMKLKHTWLIDYWMLWCSLASSVCHTFFWGAFYF